MLPFHDLWISYSVRSTCVSAFGCETPVAPPGVWLRLSHDLMSDDGEWSSLATMTAVFRCNDSEEAWHLLCRGTSWVGHVGNCSATSLSSFSWSKSAHFELIPFCSYTTDARTSVTEPVISAHD